MGDEKTIKVCGIEAHKWLNGWPYRSEPRGEWQAAIEEDSTKREFRAIVTFPDDNAIYSAWCPTPEAARDDLHDRICELAARVPVAPSLTLRDVLEALARSPARASVSSYTVQDEFVGRFDDLTEVHSPVADGVARFIDRLREYRLADQPRYAVAIADIESRLREAVYE